MKRTWLSVAVILLLIGLSVPPVGAGHNVYLQAGTTYYVSSSGGDDDNDGLSTGYPGSRSQEFPSTPYAFNVKSDDFRLRVFF